MFVLRYSDFGFEPQFQSYMHEQVEYLKTFTETSLDNCGMTDYAKELTIKTIKESRKKLNPSFDFNGIHVFFEGVSEENIAFLLNHIKGEKPPLHKKWFDDETPAYSLGEPYLQPLKTLKLLKSAWHLGAYIPIRSVV